jgi:cytoskeleton protein RodZ
MSDSTPATAGSLLKQGRLRQKLSIVECAKRTHISPRFLEALEEQRWSDLPSESHRVGFLQTYSRFLGLPTDEVMSLYRQEKQSADASSAEKTTQSKRAASEQATREAQQQGLNLWPRSPAQLVIIAALVLLGAWLGYHAFVDTDVSELPGGLVARNRPKQSRLVAPKPTNNVQKVRILAEADSWIRITENRQLRFEGILPAGTSKEWSGAGPFHLKMGNAKAVSLFWNDQAVDVASNARGGINEVQLPLPKPSGQ